MKCLLLGIFTGCVIDGILVCVAMQLFLEIALNSHPSKFLMPFLVLLGKHIPNINHSNVKILLLWLAPFFLAEFLKTKIHLHQ